MNRNGVTIYLLDRTYMTHAELLVCLPRPESRQPKTSTFEDEKKDDPTNLGEYSCRKYGEQRRIASRNTGLTSPYGADLK